MLIFGLHALLYSGIYYVVARVLAMIIAKLRTTVAKICAVVLLLIGLGSVTLLPIYGGGGHGPIRWRNLTALFHEFSRSYGEISLLMVYAFFVALLLFFILHAKKVAQEMTRSTPYHLHSVLESVESQFVENCIACGECIDACPYVQSGQLDHVDNVRLSEMRLALLRDHRYSAEAYQFARGCLLCGACETKCPLDLNPYLINIVSRLKLAQWDAPVCEQYRQDGAALQRLLPSASDNIFKILASIQLFPQDITWHREIPVNPPKTKALLFLSCMALSSYSRLKTTREIMQIIDPDFEALGGLDFCCGYLNLLSGNTRLAEKDVNRLIAAMDVFQAEVFVVDCASCYGWLRDLHSLSPLPFKFQHLTQYLDGHLHQIIFLQTIKKTITLHDACHFGRHADEYKPVRNILKKIPGLEILEMRHHRENTLCCGGPAGSYQPDLAQSACRRRLDEAAEIDPDFLMTTCDGCYSFFKQASGAYTFEIGKLLDILRQAFNLEIIDRISPFYDCGSTKEALGLAQGRIWENLFPKDAITTFLMQYFGYIK